MHFGRSLNFYGTSSVFGRNPEHFEDDLGVTTLLARFVGSAMFKKNFCSSQIENWFSIWYPK